MHWGVIGKYMNKKKAREINLWLILFNIFARIFFLYCTASSIVLKHKTPKDKPEKPPHSSVEKFTEKLSKIPFS